MPQVTPLKIAIVASGRTAKDVAESVGLAPDVVSRIANGGRVPKVNTAQALARELNTTVEALWPPDRVAA